MMGLFNFVSEAGEKLGGSVYDMLHDDEDITAPTTIQPERLNELRQHNIGQSIETLGAEVEGLQVKVEGSKVVLTGTVADQASYEKMVLAAGNQSGISEVDCQIEVRNPEPEAGFYTVQSGDTLSKIAQQQCGSAGKYIAIFEANKPLLTDPDKIYPGQVLRIPATT